VLTSCDASSLVMDKLGDRAFGQEEIVRAYKGQKQVIGRRAPQLADIVKMLQNTVSIKPTFICIDALDECVAGYRPYSWLLGCHMRHLHLEYV